MQETKPTGVFENGLQELRTLRDEVRLKLHLAGQEARDQWEHTLEPKLEKLEHQVKTATDNTKETIREAIDQVKDTFRRYRDKLVGNDSDSDSDSGSTSLA